MQVQAAGRAEGGGGSGRAQARCSPIFPESFYPLAKLQTNTGGGGGTTAGAGVVTQCTQPPAPAVPSFVSPIDARAPGL
jgi:hypothetical protein